jgi:hypothetical protein
MTPEMQAALRAPFARKQIGKLPKVWCTLCSDKRKECGDHKRAKCNVCKAFVSTAHSHVNFVGHAEVRDRLLQVDPEWNWEPLAFDHDGLPAMDGHGGMWIRLTVGGVTRPGYGHADGKTGGNAVKETIGDALRNAAMSFGVALDMWRKETLVVEDETPAREVERPAQTEEERKSELRGQINAVSKRAGLSVDQIAAEFTLWSGQQQLDIRTAGIPALVEYLHHLQRPGAA